MTITASRVNPQMIEQEIQRHLRDQSGRRMVLVDQDFVTGQLGVEVIDIRRLTAEAIFAQQPPSHVLYAVDQDDLGLPIIRWLIEHNIKFRPIWALDPAHWIHKDRHARSTLEQEFAFQKEANFDKFDYGDFENICQALHITRGVGGAYIEVGCFRGSSGGFALRYMQQVGIYRPCYFLDVFDGFSYDAARKSTDAVWVDTHGTEGIEVVASRLKRFDQPLLGRPVHVTKNNI